MLYLKKYYSVMKSINYTKQYELYDFNKTNEWTPTSDKFTS